MKFRWLACLVVAVAVLTSPARAVDPARTQANVHFNLGLKKYKSGDLDGALVSLSKALAAVADHQQANMLTGIVLIQKGIFADAISPLEKVIAAQEENVDAWNNLGIAYFQTDRWQEAEKAFLKVSTLAPDRADVFQNLGILSLKKSDAIAAITAFNKATELDPTKVESWRGLGQATAMASDSAASMLAYSKALELQPDDADLRLHVAELQYAAEKFEDLQITLEPLKTTDNPSALFLLGCVDYRAGRFEDSKAWFKKAIEAKNDYPEARFNLAITLYDQGEYEQALEQFNEVLKLHPSDKQARENLDITRKVAVQSFLKSGSESFIKEDYFTALKTWERALALDPENRVALDLVATAKTQADEQVNDLVVEGDKAFAQDKLSLAVERWNRALEIDPKNSGALAGLAKASEKRKLVMDVFANKVQEALTAGSLDRAASLARQAGEIDKKGSEALVGQVRKAQLDKATVLAQEASLAFKEGKLADAVGIYERVVELAPEDSNLRILANQAKVKIRREINEALDDARKAEKSEDYAKAYKGFKKALELQPENAEAMTGVKASSKKAKIEAIDPVKVNDLYYQGVYAFAAGENAKAVAYWEEALSLDKNHKLSKTAISRAKNKIAALKNIQ